MILLAVDSCDVYGSVAVLRENEVLGAIAHETSEEYSAWLLPAVGRLLADAGMGLPAVDVYVAANGPGSFTGLRVGLTTVKAWSEVHGKPIVGVSRLEALAMQAVQALPFIAAFADAQRGQVFGAIFRRVGGRLERVEDEMVLAPEQFVALVSQRVASDGVDWVSTEPEGIQKTEQWRVRESSGESVQRVSRLLAPVIGRIGHQRALEKRLTNALELNANYVRRSDAELFWKGKGGHGR